MLYYQRQRRYSGSNGHNCSSEKTRTRSTVASFTVAILSPFTAVNTPVEAQQPQHAPEEVNQWGFSLCSYSTAAETGAAGPQLWKFHSHPSWPNEHLESFLKNPDWFTLAEFGAEVYSLKLTGWENNNLHEFKHPNCIGVAKYSREWVEGENHWEMFPDGIIAEALKLARITQLSQGGDHPHIIRMLGFGFASNASPDGTLEPVLVLEAAKDGDLLEKLRDGDYFRLSLDQSQGQLEKKSAAIVAQILVALDWLHSHNIAHGDIKPGNIVFMQKDDDLVKLIDFGLSCDLSKADESGQIDFSSDYGAVHYKSADRLNGKISAADDMWALGCIVHRLLMGDEPPFPNEKGLAADWKKTRMEVINDLSTKGLPSLSSDDCYLSELAKEFIRGLLTLDKDRRYTAAEALQHPWIKKYVDSTRLKDLQNINASLAIRSHRERY